MSESALVFVYNADSGALNALADIARKLLAPEGYACDLCSITHSPLHMRSEWRDAMDRLGMPCEMLHRDELLERYGLTPPLPAIYVRRGGTLNLCAGPEDIARCEGVADLEALVRGRCLSQDDITPT